MTRFWTTALLAAQLLAFFTFSKAHDVKNATDYKPLLKPSDDPARVATVVIGVIAMATLSVLILLIPTVVYYKIRKSQEDGMIADKK